MRTTPIRELTNRSGRSPGGGRPRHRHAVGWLAVWSLATLLLAGSLAVGGASPARAPRASTAEWTQILDVYQTPTRVTENSSVTVHVHVASAANISLAWYSFCQLTLSYCYFPNIAMTLEAGNWYVGTTKPMSGYVGMNPGISAGYNITFQYTDNTNQTLPQLPNHYTNLSVAYANANEYVYKVTVSQPVFGVNGQIVDATTGAAISGANVTLSPGNDTWATSTATGAFSFPPILNGSYSLSVSKAGYTTRSVPIDVSGKNVTTTVSLSNASSSSPPTKPTTGSNGGATLFGLPQTTALAILAVVVVVAIAGLAIALLRRRPRSPSGGPTSTTPPSSGAP